MKRLLPIQQIVISVEEVKELYSSGAVSKEEAVQHIMTICIYKNSLIK